jgi:hypothetical protein
MPHVAHDVQDRKEVSWTLPAHRYAGEGQLYPDILKGNAPKVSGGMWRFLLRNMGRWRIGGECAKGMVKFNILE